MLLLLPLALGGGLGVLVLGTWNIFRRTTPHLSNEDLLHEDTAVAQDTKMQIVHKLSDEDRDELKKAFAKGEDFLWIYNLGQPLGDDSDDCSLDKEQYAQQVSYMMEFLIQIAESFGHIIKCTDKEGNYLGAICLMPPVHHRLCRAYMMKTAITGLGQPPEIVRNDPERYARFSSFEQTLEHHEDVMKGEYADNHWYVQTLGVAVSAQGKRVGSRLLKQAVHLAGDLPIFLDCHDGNVAFYQKNGYQVKKRYRIQPKATSGSKQVVEGFPFNGMVYHHK